MTDKHPKLTKLLKQILEDASLWFIDFCPHDRPEPVRIKVRAQTPQEAVRKVLRQIPIEQQKGSRSIYVSSSRGEQIVIIDIEPKTNDRKPKRLPRNWKTVW